jgi:RimJ/RimL family protein N-acetyltransferase
MPTIETPRLILRVPRAADAEAFDEMDTDPEVMRYIGDGRVHPRTSEQTAELIEKIRAGWENRGFGLLAVTSREAGEFLGWVTLAAPAFLPEIMPSVEIGWRFMRRNWGRGYATEAARPLLRYGFAVSDLDRIVSIRRVENTASGRVMEKIGLRFSHETVVPGNGEKVAVYALARADYESATAAAATSAATSGPVSGEAPPGYA